jgi:hypothetical protein
VDSKGKFDPAGVQARWVLGGIRPEELPSYAEIALSQGFDGSALRQLAGLRQPSSRELGSLPDRAFVEMGVRPLDNSAAVDLLIERGIANVNPTISVLVREFPDFSKRWKDHIARWGGDAGGHYIEMAEFVHFVVEDLYEKRNLDETRRAFYCLEKLFKDGDQGAGDLIGLGFFETLQNFASWRSSGNAVYEQFFGPMCKQVWGEIKQQWAGKSSLMDIIRAERDTPSK